MEAQQMNHKPFDPMAPISLHIGAQLEEQRQSVSEDALMRKHCRKMAVLAILSIAFWIAEFSQIASATKLLVPDECDGNSLNVAVLQYSAPLYTPGAIFCEVIYTICTMILLVYITHYYRLLIESRNRRRITTDLLKSKSNNPLMYRKFRFAYIVEMIVCLIQPIPLLNATTRYTASLDESVKLEFVLTQAGFALQQVNVGLFMFVRLYHLLRLFRDNTTVFKKRRDIQHFRSTRNLRPILLDAAYALRTMYHKQYTKFCAMVCLFALFFFAMAFYVAEWNNPLQIRCKFGEAQTFDFIIATYLAIITMATVGYGDYTPQSYLGRCIAMLAAITGNILKALLVTTFMRWLELSLSETGVLQWVTEVKYRRKEREAAAGVIQAFWRSIKEFRKNGDANARMMAAGILMRKGSFHVQSHVQRQLQRLTTKVDYRQVLDFTIIDERFRTLRKIQWNMTQKIAKIDSQDMDQPVKQSSRVAQAAAIESAPALKRRGSVTKVSPPLVQPKPRSPNLSSAHSRSSTSSNLRSLMEAIGRIDNHTSELMHRTAAVELNGEFIVKAFR